MSEHITSHLICRSVQTGTCAAARLSGETQHYSRKCPKILVLLLHLLLHGICQAAECRKNSSEKQDNNLIPIMVAFFFEKTSVQLTFWIFMSLCQSLKWYLNRSCRSCENFVYFVKFVRQISYRRAAFNRYTTLKHVIFAINCVAF